MNKITLPEEELSEEDRKKPKWELFGRYRIGDPGDIYLDRFALITTPWFGIKLHRINRPDRQRDLHDHPWVFLSILLLGSYVEETPAGVRTIRWFNWKGKTARHRIMTCSRSPVWTLVINGPRVRTWGFFVDGGTRFVRWYDYGKLNQA